MPDLIVIILFLAPPLLGVAVILWSARERQWRDHRTWTRCGCCHRFVNGQGTSLFLPPNGDRVNGNRLTTCRPCGKRLSPATKGSPVCPSPASAAAGETIAIDPYHHTEA